MPPPVKQKPKVKQVTTALPPPCDACGHSKIDGVRISDAKWEVKTKDGSIFLCGHHYWAHRFHIVARNYEVKEHV